jgi:multidrug resistance efflux pump
VRDHQQIEAGAPLVRLDPEQFRLALEKADAELDNARKQPLRYAVGSGSLPLGCS